MTSSLLHVSKLCVDSSTVNGNIPLIQDVSFSLEKGGVLVVAGESGSGKTILCRALTGLFPNPASFRVRGEVLFRGTRLPSTETDQLRTIRRTAIRYVFQEPLLALNPVATILSQMKFAAPGNSVSRADFEETFVRVGIPDPSRVLGSFPHQLSAGLGQRVMIAMALLGSPELLIADEPTSAVDAPLRRTLLDLLSSLQRERGMAMILVTHDLAVARVYGDNILLMYGGRVVERSGCAEFFDAPLHPYARQLVQTLRGAKPIDTLPGESVSAADRVDSGCRFATRCEKVREVCLEVEPPLEAAGAGREVRCHFWK